MSSKTSLQVASLRDDDDDEGWQDMPIVRNHDLGLALDEEDQKKYHYVNPAAQKVADELGSSMGNATGNLIDYDVHGNEWRSKLDHNESDYTRLRLNDDDTADEVHLRTKYLFDEDKAMTPLSQMQATKGLLTEAQRVAYVGLCYLTCRQMSRSISMVQAKELAEAVKHLDLWALKIMGRLYYHMELETQEQKMIESLAQHGVCPGDLIPSLMTTHTVANPEYDPEEARRQGGVKEAISIPSGSGNALFEKSEATFHQPVTPTTTSQSTPTLLQPTSPVTMPGVSTSLSPADREVTLDIRWTILCDLFLLLVADSVYDSRSRVLLESLAAHLGLGWLDVVKFEKRVTDALEIQESVEKLEQQDVIVGRAKASKRKRIVMMGLATLGGGLVIGLSAGLLAPVIGAGLGAALTTIGVSGTSTFLAGAGGAAMITTGGVLTGSGIAVRGMARRTRQVRIFDFLPVHNDKRVNCIVTVPGFMNGPQDDVRLPFSVLDPIVGDVYSVLWEPEMMGETGNALKILTTEVITQLGQTVLQATVMTALMSALQWPIILTKLGYLIDNPWSNALDRAKAAGQVLAEVLIQRNLGVRPITLIGFSLGARVIFYALLELSKRRMFGIVQDVFLLGATITASLKSWYQVRSVVAGRFVNAYARNDWVLNYLFRASSGSLNTVAGLRPVEGVPGLENIDVTDKIAGHMSYRVYMPVILDQLGFPVTADYFDEPEDLQMEVDRSVERPEGNVSSIGKRRLGFFKRQKSENEAAQPSSHVSRPPSTSSFTSLPAKGRNSAPEDQSEAVETTTLPPESTSLPAPRAGFDFEAIQHVLRDEQVSLHDLGPTDPGGFKAPEPLSQSETTSPNIILSETLRIAPTPLFPLNTVTSDSQPISAVHVAIGSTGDSDSLNSGSELRPPRAPSIPPISGDDLIWPLNSLNRDPVIPGANVAKIDVESPASEISTPSYGISFGGVDGTISTISTSEPTGLHSEWGPSKKGMFVSNPWED